MKAPEFWRRRGPLALALSPLGLVTRALTVRRLRKRGHVAGIAVICAGNAGVGGSGKTVLALDLLERLPGRPYALTRGYGGKLKGPVLVDPLHHSAADVGDEALLLAAAAPTVVARNRAAGARLALAEGATCIVMDDGLQNPDPVKKMSFLVIDGGFGFGNGMLLPAGPLREPVAAAAMRCRAAVLIGPDTTDALAALPAGFPVLRARMVPECTTPFAGRPVIAFAGIGRPEKFFESALALGANLVGREAFADHHAYSDSDATRLLKQADERGADLVTTEKDFVKLPDSLRRKVLVITVRLAWEDESRLEALLNDELTKS